MKPKKLVIRQLLAGITYAWLLSSLFVVAEASTQLLFGITTADQFGKVDFLSIDSNTGHTTSKFLFNVGAGNQVGEMTYHEPSGLFITTLQRNSGYALGLINPVTQSFTEFDIGSLPGTAPKPSGIEWDSGTNRLFVAFAADGSVLENQVAHLALDGTALEFTSVIADDIDALGYRNTTNQLLGFDLNAFTSQRIFSITGLFASPSVSTIATPPWNNEIGDAAIDPVTDIIFLNGFDAGGGSLLRLDGDTTYFTVGNYGASSQVVGIAFAPVPLPAAAWLFGSGLLGLVGIARRKKAA